MTKMTPRNNRLFREAWEKGLSCAEIAHMFGIHQTTVSRHSRRLGLVSRHVESAKEKRDMAERDRVRKMVPMPPEKTLKSPKKQAEQDLSHLSASAQELIRTKGQWTKLSKIAAREGWTSARVQQELHRARALL